MSKQNKVAAAPAAVANKVVTKLATKVPARAAGKEDRQLERRFDQYHGRP